MLTARICGLAVPLALTSALAASLTACGTSPEYQGQPHGNHGSSEHPPAPPAEVFKPLLQQPIPGLRGKSFTSATVSFAPGVKALPHRHGEAFVFAYVLVGTVRSKVEGQPAKTFHQGEYWVEQPGAHHLQTQNVSKTEPAKLLVAFVADSNAVLKVDDPHN